MKTYTLLQATPTPSWSVVLDTALRLKSLAEERKVRPESFVTRMVLMPPGCIFTEHTCRHATYSPCSYLEL